MSATILPPATPAALEAGARPFPRTRSQVAIAAVRAPSLPPDATAPATVRPKR